MTKGEKRVYSVMTWIQNSSKLVSVILFIVSAVLVGVGVYFAIILADNSMTVNSYTPTTAVVDYAAEDKSYYSGRRLRSVSSTNNVVAHYEVDGAEYSVHITGLGVNETRLQQGDTITVYYNPSDPSQAIVKASAGFVTISVVFIIIFAVLAIVLTKKGIKILNNGIKLNIPDKDDHGFTSYDAPAYRNTTDYYHRYSDENK
ncbi:MAG: DUF3592 domain-containing protein [Clostridia bacterium]|nr:DUF3592 domain-containing protein [Clostridia bacterium]